MTQSVHPSITALRHWQSSVTMIPVVLDLLREKLNYLDRYHFSLRTELSSEEMQAYRSVYHRWKKKGNLNPKQKEWMQEMDSYLNMLGTLVHN